MNIRSLIILIGTLSALSGCNSYTPKEQGANGQLIAGSANPDFAMIQNYILQPSCISCHSSAAGNIGGINLETYANVISYIGKIQSTVVGGGNQMPPSPAPPLSKQLQQLLSTWVSHGAPQFANSSGGPIPTPTPSNLQPTFSSISQNIFATNCVACHGPGGSAAGMPVTDLNFLLSSQWIVANNLSQSELFQSITTNPPRMPPGGALTPNEITAIQTWINNGAQNN